MEEIIKVWVTFSKAASPYLHVTPLLRFHFLLVSRDKTQGFEPAPPPVRLRNFRVPAKAGGSDKNLGLDGKTVMGHVFRRELKFIGTG